LLAAANACGACPRILPWAISAACDLAHSL
jgi:hypothetical protein